KVRPPAEIAGRAPDREPDHERDRGRRQADREREGRGRDDPGEEVAPEVVRAEGMRSGRRQEAIVQPDLPGARREERRSRGDEPQEQHGGEGGPARPGHSAKEPPGAGPSRTRGSAAAPATSAARLQMSVAMAPSSDSPRTTG